ncbi:pnp [Lepeophtheirus salmonis]|uniref:polyribonucleotide nucleotidyltransferase n=1 Tax=Lepeophtheirus salmonis TaxID=72036 RepID=A0A7R8H6E0_LEPSM|nr:pnp [Lepeophtheirus salmonis]CAF2886748.1 pnp [Lepeophtheirus salmonis]
MSMWRCWFKIKWLQNYQKLNSKSVSTLTIPLGDKRGSLELQTGRLARFADGSVLSCMGNTSVNVTVVSKKSPSSNTSFLPLTVDFRQKSAAAGRIPTNHLRRELGPTAREILISRVIDRSVRPLFPKRAVRVGTSNDPGNIKGEAIVIEADADVLEENIFVDAVEYGLQSCSSIASHIAEWSSNIHQPKRALTYYPSENNTNNEILQSVELLTANKLRNLYESKKHDKIERDSAMFAILENSLPSLKESFPNSNSDIFYSAFYDINKTVISDLIFEDGLRPDGRKPGEMRTLSCEVGLHAPLHGSALFQRGQTQVLCTVALDSIESSLKNDYMSTLTGGIKEKNFFLHYEFPSYATNEISRSFVAGRRELGHGALAEKALMPLIPKNYPFTIRLTSEVLESNGSSSMATVCGGSLALMDAGVDIKSPAAGVAIGLISRKHDSNEEEHTLLLDIIGQEDYVGNMDFKIAGTSEGITALQLDVKIPGLSFDIIKAATSLGLEGIKSCVKNYELLSFSSQIDKSNLPKNRYNYMRITPGDSEDTWNIFAHNSEALDEATDLINNSLKEEKEIEFTFGALYKVNVLETNASGIKVQIDPAYPLVYIPNSQLTSNKISHSSAAGIKEGQELLVKCYGRDPVTGNLRLSRKALTVAQSAAVKSISSSSKRSDMIQVQSSSDSLFQAGVSSSNSYDVDKMVVNSRPKSLDCASVGFKLSLLYRGKDSITNYPRFVEAVSDKDKEKSTQKNTFPTFKPKELFKMDVWSSSSKQNTIKDINRLLSKCSNLSNLRKKEDFLRYFRMQLQYCRNLNPLVSGPLSKIISLEIENEKKDIYFDLECILDTLNSVDSASNVGNKVIKLLNKFVESPYESEIDHKQKSVHMLDLLCSNIRIMEDHVANIVCDKK